jgi:hypothetical protein
MKNRIKIVLVVIVLVTMLISPTYALDSKYAFKIQEINDNLINMGGVMYDVNKLANGSL